METLVPSKRRMGWIKPGTPPEDVPPPRPVVVFPRGMIEQVRAFACSFSSQREVAARFAARGLTYELLHDIISGEMDMIEDDVARVTIRE
jgi:hypothetical protein